AQQVLTEEGPQPFLAVNAKTSSIAVGDDGETEDKKSHINETAWAALLGFFKGPHSWTKYNEWKEATKTALGGKMGNDTFSKAREALVKAGRVQVNDDGLYQIVFGAQSSPDPQSSPSPTPRGVGLGGLGLVDPGLSPGLGLESVEATTEG